jgi:hypothetical protein
LTEISLARASIIPERIPRNRVLLYWRSEGFTTALPTIDDGWRVRATGNGEEACGLGEIPAGVRRTCTVLMRRYRLIPSVQFSTTDSAALASVSTIALSRKRSPFRVTA